jgi:hypothetical protein
MIPDDDGRQPTERSDDPMTVNPRKTEALPPSSDGRVSIIRALARELVAAEERGEPDVVLEDIRRRLAFFRRGA